MNIHALLAAADAIDSVAGGVFNYEDRDKYGRALDLLDALGLIQSWRVNDAGDEPFEVATLTAKNEGGPLLLVGPFGYTPNRDRTQPTERLAAKKLDVDPEAAILLGRIARQLTSGESDGSMLYAQRIKAGIALSRLLRQAGQTLVSGPQTDDEAGRDSVVIPLNPTRLHVVTQPEREGA